MTLSHSRYLIGKGGKPAFQIDLRLFQRCEAVAVHAKLRSRGVFLLVQVVHQLRESLPEQSAPGVEGHVLANEGNHVGASLIRDALRRGSRARASCCRRFYRGKLEVAHKLVKLLFSLLHGEVLLVVRVRRESGEKRLIFGDSSPRLGDGDFVLGDLSLDIKGLASQIRKRLLLSEILPLLR